MRRWRQAETDTFDQNERTKNGKEGKKKTNNNKPNLIETLLACLPFIRVRAKSRLQHSCQSSQIHDGWSPPYSPFPFSQGRQRDSIERRRGIKTIQGLSVFGRSASHVKKYPPKRRNRKRRKKRPMIEEAQKESVAKEKHPKTSNLWK